MLSPTVSPGPPYSKNFISDHKPPSHCTPGKSLECEQVGMGKKVCCKSWLKWNSWQECKDQRLLVVLKFVRTPDGLIAVNLFRAAGRMKNW